MSWYRIQYAHHECDAFWIGEWSCACNDRCPVCDREIECEDYDNLTEIIEFDEATGEWVVAISPPEAEHSPCYRRTRFNEKQAAEAFHASCVDARLDAEYDRAVGFRRRR